MNETQFWQLISQFDWEKEGDDAAVIEPCVQALSGMPEIAICDFYDLLSEKLYLLDGREYAEHSEEKGEYVSADLFLYARCAVVANGHSYYEKVLRNPEKFPKNLFFEVILSIPSRAWVRKMGTPFGHFPKYMYETGFNPAGWGADAIVL